MYIKPGTATNGGFMKGEVKFFTLIKKKCDYMLQSMLNVHHENVI